MGWKKLSAAGLPSATGANGQNVPAVVGAAGWAGVMGRPGAVTLGTGNEGCKRNGEVRATPLLA